MSAINLLFPVFFMIIIGIICRIKGWVTPEQKDGTKKVVFNIFFPILIFNILFSSSISSSTIYIVIYVLIAFIIAYIIGLVLRKWTGERFEKLSPFMMMTCEGGSVALPLYTSIVGSAYAVNTVTFDIAGVIIGFIIIPIMVAKMTSSEVGIKELIIKIFTNSFVLAVLFGILLNILGIYESLRASSLFDTYSNTITTATGSISGLILFTIGYDFKLSTITIKPLLKLTLLRILTSIAIILGFFVLFPELMTSKIYAIGVIVYFMCPTGFATPLQLIPLYKDDVDESYLSTFLSLYMVVTLLVFAIVTIAYS
ncbi:AEC family transporter [Breznakia pachnodae]|uniref:Permease n=1 Tax=Breznakia pachnodae TaxID=265178 RepID=A0ABU0E3I3_9FIRM|nr:AEC family transporter [Breznakia pachnodae]MDQ0361055.1 putative permease [Breznakia pachnodae]